MTVLHWSFPRRTEEFSAPFAAAAPPSAGAAARRAAARRLLQVGRVVVGRRADVAVWTLVHLLADGVDQAVKHLLDVDVVLGAGLKELEACGGSASTRTHLIKVFRNLCFNCQMKYIILSVYIMVYMTLFIRCVMCNLLKLLYFMSHFPSLVPQGGAVLSVWLCAQSFLGN